MKSPYDGKTKMHYWCPKCVKWVMHKEHKDDYKPKQSKFKDKNKSKAGPSKKKVTFKRGKKQAYSKATIAYKAALAKIDSEYQDEEGDAAEEMDEGSVDEMYDQ
jgi:hypothetical protein